MAARDRESRQDVPIDASTRFERRALLASIPLAAAAVAVPWGKTHRAVATEGAPARFALDSPPVLQNPTPDGMTVVWAVPRRATGWVEYGDRPDSLESRTVVSRHGLVAMDDRFLSARIGGLTPGQRVYYRVVSVPIDFQNAYEIHRGEPVASDTHQFTTPDSQVPTATFAVINDTHENAQTLAALTAALADAPGDLLVWNGDVFNDVYSDDQVVAQALRPAGVAYAADRPVLFTSGNHDVRGPLARGLARAFSPWSNEEPLGRCFAVRHGPVAIIGLDTGEDKPDVRPVFAGLADFEPYRRAQRDWLRGALRRPEIASAPYLVACCHIPLNGLPGQNGGDTEDDFARYSKLSRTLWAPLLEEAGAQLVISGHTHNHRYDAPTEKRPWGQLVGGGPQPGYATLIRGRADAESLEVTMHALDGRVLGTWRYKPRSTG